MEVATIAKSVQIPDVFLEAISTGMDRDKSIIVYYSLSGHTERVARMIQSRTGFDIVHIATIEPYEQRAHSAMSFHEHANLEVKNEYTPLIFLPVDGLKDYGRVVLCTPTWCERVPPPVLTFLRTYSFAGTVLVPVQTYTDNPGEVMRQIEFEAQCAYVRHPLKVQFSPDNGRMVMPKYELYKWVDSIL